MKNEIHVAEKIATHIKRRSVGIYLLLGGSKFATGQSLLRENKLQIGPANKTKMQLCPVFVPGRKASAGIGPTAFGRESNQVGSFSEALNIFGMKKNFPGHELNPFEGMLPVTDDFNMCAVSGTTHHDNVPTSTNHKDLARLFEPCDDSQLHSGSGHTIKNWMANLLKP